MGARLAPWLARLATTLGLLGLLVLLVDTGRLAAQLAGVRLAPVLLVIALTAGDRVLMAFKWSRLLAARGIRVGWWTAIRAYFSASFVGLFLPVTVGADAVRVLALRHHGAVEITASIVVERALGLVAVATVAIAGCVVLAAALTAQQSGALVALVGALLIVGGLGFVASLPIASRLAASSRRAPALVRKFAEAYGRYREHPGPLAAFYLLSVVETLVPALIGYASAVALGLSVPLLVFVATVPLALAVARLPISLGGFGVQEASFVYLAGLLGVAGADALAIMLVADAALVVTLLPAAFDTTMMDLRKNQ